MAYASRTGTRRNLASLRGAGWRLLISATGCHRSEGFPYAIDNGAWTAFQQGRPFDADAFRRLLDSHGAGADWAILPDIVAGGLDSLGMSMRWLGQVREQCPRWLIAVQDGMELADVAPHLGPAIGIAIGGSTEWKEQTAPAWGRLARDAGCWLHMLRVNTARRIALAAGAGCHSFDGTSASRFSKTLRPLDNARRQTAMEF